MSNSLTIDKPFYRPAEVAGMLAVDRSTVYRWMDSGALPSLTINETTRRIPGPALEKFLAGNRTGAAPAPEVAIESEAAAVEAAFLGETGVSWVDFIQSWRDSSIEHSAANEVLLLRALGIRSLLAGVDSALPA